MLCVKCGKNSANIHLTTITDGKMSETLHLCPTCAPSQTQMAPDTAQSQENQMIGKSCKFCGQETSVHFQAANGDIYCCPDCGYEFGRILMDIYTSERPDLLQQIQSGSSFMTLYSDPEFKAWLLQIHQKAAEILKKRK